MRRTLLGFDFTLLCFWGIHLTYQKHQPLSTETVVISDVVSVKFPEALGVLAMLSEGGNDSPIIGISGSRNYQNQPQQAIPTISHCIYI